MIIIVLESADFPEESDAGYLYAAALASKVFVSGLPLFQNVFRDELHQAPVAPLGFRVDDYVKAMGYQFNIEILLCCQWVAVAVDRTRFRAFYVNLSGFKSLDMAVLRQCLVEHLHSNLRRENRVERLHDNYVEQPILHRSMGSDVGIIAIL